MSGQDFNRSGGGIKAWSLHGLSPPRLHRDQEKHAGISLSPEGPAGCSGGGLPFRRVDSWALTFAFHGSFRETGHSRRRNRTVFYTVGRYQSRRPKSLSSMRKRLMKSRYSRNAPITAAFCSVSASANPPWAIALMD